MSKKTAAAAGGPFPAGQPAGRLPPDAGRPALTPEGVPVIPPDVKRPDGFIADAPLCAILSIDGETAVSGRITPLGNVQVNLVSPHFNVAIRMNGQMAARVHAGLTALIKKMEPAK